MKNLFTLMFLLLLLPCVLPLSVEAQNAGRMIPLDSKIYSYMEFLYSRAGKTAPNTARPWSTAQALRLLDQVSLHALGSEDTALAEHLTASIRAELDPDPLFAEKHFDFHLRPRINVEGFYAVRGGGAESSEEEQWLHGYRERLPQFELPLEFGYADRLYILGDFQLLEEYNAAVGSYGRSNYSNWANPADPKLDSSVPLRSFASWGGDWWHIQFGRDRHSWGVGRKENLFLSDQSDYLDALDFRLFSDSFAYSGIAAALDPIRLSYDENGDFNSFENFAHLYYVAHRLEAVFWEQLTVGASEALMIAGNADDRDFLPIKHLNFFYPFHNWFETGLTNALMSLDVKWRPAPGFGLYGQFVMDEFQTSYEANAGTTESNLFGWLLGADWTHPLGEGYIRAYGEYVHSDPFLYLYHKQGDTRLYNVRWYESFLSDERERANYIVRPIGSSFGSDARSYTIQLQYERPDSYTATLQTSFIEKGEVDYRTEATDKAVSEANSGSFPTGVVERALLFHLSGEYFLTDSIALQGDTYYRHRWNLDNQSGVTGFGLECALGVRYRF